MKDFIIIAGAPGVGKTTISRILQKKLSSPLIDFGSFREFHLLPDWSNENDMEERMSFENLIFTLKNYAKYGYKNVLVNDLKDSKIQELEKELKEFDYLIATLIISDDQELRKRVLSPRDSGWKDAEAAVQWNRELLQRSLLKNEHKIDNTRKSAIETAEEISHLL